MNTVNVELTGMIRVVVPVACSGRMPDEQRLLDIARQAYEITVNNGGPAHIHTEWLKPGPVELVTRPNLEPLELIRDIVSEYYVVKPGLDWYRESGHQVTDGEVMLQAIRNVLMRFGYTVVELGNEQEPMTATADSIDSAF